MGSTLGWPFFSPTKKEQTNPLWIDVDAEAPTLWPPDVKSWLTGKDPDARKDWRQEKKSVTEDEMVGWHHWLNRREFEQILGDSEGQRNLARCSPWSLKDSVGHDLVTEQWTLYIWRHFFILTPWVQLNKFGRNVQTVQWESQGLNFSSTTALESLEQDNFSESISPTKQ